MPNSEVHWPASPAKDHVDKLPGGLADKNVPEDFDPEQLALGIKIELEHTKDKSLAREIAMDHLKEDSRYYTELLKMEGTLEKAAIGLTSFQESLSTGFDDQHGSEVLSHKGSPQNPGLKRDQEAGEETDFLGAASDIVDVPPKNEKYKKKELKGKEFDPYTFFRFLDGDIRVTKSYSTYLDDLFRGLLKLGKSEEANIIHHILKESKVFDGEEYGDVLQRYADTKENLKKLARNKYIKVDTLNDCSFIFTGKHKNGGCWFYSYGANAKPYPVDELELDNIDLDPIVRVAIQGLAEKYVDNTLDGLIYLRNVLKQGELLDWYPAEAGMFLSSYDKLAGNLRVDNVNELHNEIDENRKEISYVSAANNSSLRGSLRSIINEILSGKASLDKKEGKELLSFAKKVGGTENNLEPLISLIIETTSIGALENMMKDAERKHLSIFRQVKRAARKKRIK